MLAKRRSSVDIRGDLIIYAPRDAHALFDGAARLAWRALHPCGRRKVSGRNVRHRRRKPLSRYSAYTLWKPDYFIGTDRPQKTLVQRGHVLYGRTWQPATSVMTDYQKGTSTEMTWSGYAVDVSVDERTMSPGGIVR